jgi:hypothetical protein
MPWWIYAPEHHENAAAGIRQRGERWAFERILASALRPSCHAAIKLVYLARSKRAGLPISASTFASHGRYEV